jgi:hypothetical protein
MWRNYFEFGSVINPERFVKWHKSGWYPDIGDTRFSLSICSVGKIRGIMKSLKIMEVIPTKDHLSTVIQWLSTENKVSLRVEQTKA